jgi:hypothetical protein
VKRMCRALHSLGLTIGYLPQERLWLQVPINGEAPKQLVDSVREDCACAVASICRLEEGRKAVMAVGGHDSLRKGYEYEEHPGTMEAMEAAARMLMGVELDDGAKEPGAAGGMVMMA